MYHVFMAAYIYFLLFLASALPAAAVEPMDSAQKRCFCVQFSKPGDPVPYYLGKMDWPECKNRKVVNQGRLVIFEMGLLSCEDLMACLGTPKEEKAVREAAMQEVTDISNALLDCCPKDKKDCDKKCIARLEPKLNKAKARSAKLERAALHRQDACIAAKPVVKPPEEFPGTAPGAPIGASN
jgi:hypothetical protein